MSHFDSVYLARDNVYEPDNPSSPVPDSPSELSMDAEFKDFFSPSPSLNHTSRASTVSEPVSYDDLIDWAAAPMASDSVLDSFEEDLDLGPHFPESADMTFGGATQGNVPLSLPIDYISATSTLQERVQYMESQLRKSEHEDRLRAWSDAVMTEEESDMLDTLLLPLE